MPSASPTQSQAPSFAPSVAPTLAPTRVCNVAMNVTCTELVSGMECSAYQEALLSNLPTLGEMCWSDPVAISLLYVGGDCRWSETDLYCEDHNGGPPVDFGEESRVQIKSASTDGLTYFDGNLSVLDPFTIEHPNLEPIADLLEISIFDPVDSILLQRTMVPFNCKEGTVDYFDRYGAIQFYAFNSIEQGSNSNFANQSFTYKPVFRIQITNEGVASVFVGELTANSSFPEFDVDLSGQLPRDGIIDAGASHSVDLLPAIDLTTNGTHEFLVTGRGAPEAAEAGTTCDVGELLTVTVEAPTFGTSNHNDDFSAMDADEGPCEIKSSMHCVGRTYHGSLCCNDVLRYPGLYPSVIEFALDGGGCESPDAKAEACTEGGESLNAKANACNESTSSQGNTCLDCFGFFGGLGRVDQEFLVSLQAQDLLVERIVNRSQPVRLESSYGLGPYVVVSIKTAETGRLLQQQRIWTSDKDTFVVGERFGALILTEAVPSISSRPLASVNLQLRIENQGSFGYNVSSAVVTTIPETSITSLLDNFLGHAAVGPGDAISVPYLTIRADEWDDSLYDSTYSWSASIAGVSDADGSQCAETIDASFTDLFPRMQ